MRVILKTRLDLSTNECQDNKCINLAYLHVNHNHSHICVLIHIYIFVFITKDDITGDGTTSNVLIIGELLKQVIW